MISRRSGPAVAAAGPKVGAARGASRLQGQSYEILRDSAASRPLFFCIGARWFAVLRGLCSRRASGGRKVARFSSSPPLFFRRSPALFSFGGRVALLRGVKCAVPRARVSRTRQPLFVFSLHRFTHPAQPADSLPIAGEGFAFSPSPRSSLRTAAVAVGVRRNGREAKLANSC